jgi:KUP system potassium uptake protein
MGDTPAIEPSSIPAPASTAEATGTHEGPRSHGAGFWALALGSLGVVFGDIGTSPLYAMRIALSHSKTASQELAVLGVVSLVLWTLTLIVTVKYVVFLMRADNKGEGGTLALMALAQRALGRRSKLIFFLGVIGAALFYGDGIITPAMTVLASVELIKVAPGVPASFHSWVVPIAAGILIALFWVQAKGTHRVASLFGPICAVWFLTGS